MFSNIEFKTSETTRAKMGGMQLIKTKSKQSQNNKSFFCVSFSTHLKFIRHAKVHEEILHTSIPAI